MCQAMTLYFLCIHSFVHTKCPLIVKKKIQDVKKFRYIALLDDCFLTFLKMLQMMMLIALKESPLCLPLRLSSCMQPGHGRNVIIDALFAAEIVFPADGHEVFLYGVI